MKPSNNTRTAYRWTLGTVQFDEGTWQLRVDGELIAIERKPMDVLLLLFLNAGEVVTREELIDAIWKGRVVVEAALTNTIGKLRKAFGEANQAAIITVPRVGYRLVGKVEREVVAREVVPSHFQVGDSVPRRPGWHLVRALDSAERSEVWLAAHAKSGAQRVYKFSFDGSRLYALKREVTISRLLRESLGEREEFVYVSDWDFSNAPYFIESHFGGMRLDEWAEEQDGLGAMPLGERIALLASIAEAVAMAHDVGVLHKDLKPANLLVTGAPGNWQPRLVDFGSGRVLEPDRLEALGISRLGLTATQMMDANALSGTLPYLAPELLAGQVPTVRSDIYALGVVLYQLCVGDFRRPMSPGWEGDIDDALLREDIAAAANGNPELRPASARELALRLRNREQRALQREREIAAARQAAINERALAAARARRPWMLAGVSLLAIGCVVTWVMYQSVAEANVRAVREMRVAQAVTQFLNRDLLATANPVHGGRANIPLIEAIDRAEPAIQSRFSDDPQVAANIHRTLGEAYYQLSIYDKAREQFAHAATRFAQLGDGASEDTAEAQLREIQSLAISGERDTARERLDTIWPGILHLASASPSLHVEAYQLRGLIELASMRYADAILPLEEAVKSLNDLPDADPKLLIRVTQKLNFARTMSATSSAIAEASQQQVVAKLSQDEGEEALNVLRARQQLAGSQVQAGKGHEMEQTYIELVRDYAQVMGPQHEYTLRATLGLANVYTKLAQWEDCERHARIAYVGLNNQVGPAHAHTLNAQNTLAVAELRLGRVESAEYLLETGVGHLQGKEDTLSQIFLAAFQLNLIHLRLAQERIAEARALATTVQTHAPEMIRNDSDFAGELSYLDARVTLAEGDRAGGRERLETALELLRKRNRDEYWIIQDILRMI